MFLTGRVLNKSWTWESLLFERALKHHPKLSPVQHLDLLPLLFIVLQTDNEAPNTKAKSPSAFSAEGLSTIWCPHGDLNPSRRRERAVSWARLDDRDLILKYLAGKAPAMYDALKMVCRVGIEPMTI